MRASANEPSARSCEDVPRARMTFWTLSSSTLRSRSTPTNPSIINMGCCLPRESVS